MIVDTLILSSGDSALWSLEVSLEDTVNHICFTWSVALILFFGFLICDCFHVSSEFYFRTARHIGILKMRRQPANNSGANTTTSFLSIMQRLKRIQFWGRNVSDDFLLQQVIDGSKTATTGLARDWHVPNGDYDDGGYVAGDTVEVYDLRGRLRCLIRITEVYETTFGSVPEKLWKGEVCTSAEDFRHGHRACWSNEILTDDTPVIGCHFELVKAER